MDYSNRVPISPGVARLYNIHMIPLISVAIERYAVEHSAPASALLDEIAHYTQEHFPQGAPMLVGPLEAALLQFLVGLLGARRILEIGLFTGYSALAMAEALPPDGRLISLEKNAETAGVAQEFFARSEHGHKIEVRIGDAQTSLAAMREREFDLVFIDADKENYIAYYDTVLPWVRPGGLIAADNVLWSGRVLEPKDASDRAIVAFNTYVAHDARVEATMLTVRDGIYLLRKK